MKVSKFVDLMFRRNNIERAAIVKELHRAEELDAASEREENPRLKKRLKLESETIRQAHQRFEDRTRGLSEQIQTMSKDVENPIVAEAIRNTCDPESSLGSLTFEEIKCSCGTERVFIADSALYRCPSCHKVTQYVNFEIQAFTQPRTVEDPTPSSSSSEPERPESDTLYREHVEQFVEGSPPTPPEIMETLLRLMHGIDFRSRSKVLPTLIVNMLRKSNHANFIKFAARIERELTSSPVPVFSRALADRMIERYGVIMTVYKSMRAKVGKSKMINFTALDRLFLKLEGRDDLIGLFDQHKTIGVIHQENIIIEECRKEAAKISALPW
jgi:hypothetical protein